MRLPLSQKFIRERHSNPTLSRKFNKNNLFTRPGQLEPMFHYYFKMQRKCFLFDVYRNDRIIKMVLGRFLTLYDGYYSWNILFMSTENAYLWNAFSVDRVRRAHFAMFHSTELQVVPVAHFHYNLCFLVVYKRYTHISAIPPVSQIWWSEVLP